MNKSILLEKYIKVAVRKTLKEEEEHQRKAEKAMYMIYRFPGLKKVIEELMSPAFGSYINSITIIAPKPTTFQIELINSQSFNVKYLGKGNFSVKVSGKKYNISNLGESERASQAIADLLELNYAPEEGKEQSSDNKKEKDSSSSDADLNADLEAAANEPVPEETPEETPEA